MRCVFTFTICPLYLCLVIVSPVYLIVSFVCLLCVYLSATIVSCTTRLILDDYVNTRTIHVREQTCESKHVTPYNATTNAHAQTTHPCVCVHCMAH